MHETGFNLFCDDDLFWESKFDTLRDFVYIVIIYFLFMQSCKVRFVLQNPSKLLCLVRWCHDTTLSKIAFGCHFFWI